jgi:hypothetical protein
LFNVEAVALPGFWLGHAGPLKVFEMHEAFDPWSAVQKAKPRSEFTVLMLP